MIKYLVYPFVSLSLLLTSACHRASLGPEEYVSWVQETDNGLANTISIGSLEYRLTHKPIDAMILQVNEGVLPSHDSLEKLRSEFGEMIYFTFQMKVADNSSVLQYEGDENTEALRLQHFFGLIQDDFQLVSGTDTFPCGILHYERDYGIDPFETFSLAFEHPSSNTGERITVIYNDQVMGTGPVRFSYDASDLLDQPQMNID